MGWRKGEEEVLAPRRIVYPCCPHGHRIWQFIELARSEILGIRNWEREREELSNVEGREDVELDEIHQCPWGLGSAWKEQSCDFSSILSYLPNEPM